MKHYMDALMLVVGLFAGVMPLSAQQQRGGVPAEQAVLDAFQNHSVVIVGEMHGSVEIHAFIQSLIANPAFSAVVRDVVLEALNVRYQPLLDRYVAGENVPRDSVALAWRNTTQLLLWDTPVYSQTLDAIRALNGSLPPNRRLRVLASDPPVDWTTISKASDFPHDFGYRDWQTVSVVRQEVLARHRKALIVFGSEHAYKTRPLLPDAPVDTLMEDLARGLERIAPGSTYSIVTVSGNVGNRLKSLLPAHVRPRTLFDVSRNGWSRRSSSLVFGDTVTLFHRVEGRRVAARVSGASLPLLGQVIDGILYIGPYSNSVEPDAAPYMKDAALLAETRRRISLMKEIYGVDIWSDELDQMIGCYRLRHGPE